MRPAWTMWVRACGSRSISEPAHTDRASRTGGMRRKGSPETGCPSSIRIRPFLRLPARRRSGQARAPGGRDRNGPARALRAVPRYHSLPNWPSRHAIEARSMTVSPRAVEPHSCPLFHPSRRYRPAGGSGMAPMAARRLRRAAGIDIDHPRRRGIPGTHPGYGPVPASPGADALRRRVHCWPDAAGPEASGGGGFGHSVDSLCVPDLRSRMETRTRRVSLPPPYTAPRVGAASP